MKFEDFNDETLPLGVRKIAYIKYAVHKGTTLINAKKQANKKFGFEKKPGIFAIVKDYGRTGQRSFEGSKEIFQSYDLRKYNSSHWIIDDEIEDIEKLKMQIKEAGWDLIYVTISG